MNNSATGVAQLRWGYGFGTVPPVNNLPPAPPGEVLAAWARTAASTCPASAPPTAPNSTCGTATRAATRRWNYTPNKELTVYGNKCMQVGGPRRGRRSGGHRRLHRCDRAAVEPQRGPAMTSVANPALCLEAAGAGTGNGTRSTSGPATAAPARPGPEADRRTRTDLNLRARRHRRGAPGDRADSSRARSDRAGSSAGTHLSMLID